MFNYVNRSNKFRKENILKLSNKTVFLYLFKVDIKVIIHVGICTDLILLSTGKYMGQSFVDKLRVLARQILQLQRA